MHGEGIDHRKDDGALMGRCPGQMQIRAGTGGDEAALFAADLLRMYQKYAELQSWRLVNVSESQAENGGLKEVIVEVIACS